jgi:hypothetical protein
MTPLIRTTTTTQTAIEADADEDADVTDTASDPESDVSVDDVRYCNVQRAKTTTTQ